MFSDAMLHHPLLDHDQEIALARRIQCGDAAALDELIRHNLRLVYGIARRYGTDDPGTEFDDLVQEGMIGLLTAARRYDQDRDTRFSTYATYWIRQHIQRAAVTAGTIPRSANPSYQAVKPANIRARAIRQAPILRLDAPLRDQHSDESDSTLMDTLADDSPSVEEQALSNIEVERIITALHLTPPGEATVRDWLAGFTREEAGKRHGLSRSWIDTRLRVSNAYHFKQKIRPELYKEEIMPTATGKTCIEPGCDQPRHINKNGKELQRCHEHMKQYWRDRSRAQNAATRQPPPPPSYPSSPVGAHRNTPSHEMKRVSGDDDSDCTCANCIYREIVTLLAARNPRIAELVQVMQTERRLRDELDI